jgi:integrase
MILTALRRHKAEQAAYRLRVGPEKYHNLGLICAGRDGKPFKPESFTEMFRRLIREAGVTRVTLHDLRHTHASHLIKGGERVKVISDRLGHANAAMTLNRYAHLFQGMDQAAAGKIDALLGHAAGE